MFNNWVRVASVISDYVDKMDELTCPYCGENQLDYVYVGDLETRIGYEIVWCNHCLRGIQISGVKVPLNVEMLSFNGDEDLNERIPKYSAVTPDE